MMREATLLAVRFPDPLRSPPVGGRGPTRVLQRVDDPLADRLKNGDPTLGWAGDSRLQLYLDVPAGRWELWRLEHDNELRKVSGWSTEQYGSANIVPAVILWLRSHDTQDGFDPHLHVVQRHDQARANVRNADKDRMTDAAERLVHGLKKDGAI